VSMDSIASMDPSVWLSQQGGFLLSAKTLVALLKMPIIVFTHRETLLYPPYLQGIKILYKMKNKLPANLTPKHLQKKVWMSKIDFWDIVCNNSGLTITQFLPFHSLAHRLCVWERERERKFRIIEFHVERTTINPLCQSRWSFEILCKL
jgi:hypothetical protein